MYYLHLGVNKILLVKKDLPPSNKLRQRKIIFFNLPYSVSVETNIEITFLKFINKYFP